MATLEIKVPDIGDFAEVTVIELMVKPGDTVKPDQSLITVESDKASMEIPSSHGGVVKELKVKIGDKVAEGSLVLLLEAASHAPAPAVSRVSEEKTAVAPVRNTLSDINNVAISSSLPLPRERAGLPAQSDNRAWCRPVQGRCA